MHSCGSLVHHTFVEFGQNSKSFYEEQSVCVCWKWTLNQAGREKLKPAFLLRCVMKAEMEFVATVVRNATPRPLSAFARLAVQLHTLRFLLCLLALPLGLPLLFVLVSFGVL